MNLLPLKQRRSILFTLVSVLAAAYAAPYLVPDSPDSLVFRDGILPALLLLAAAYPARAAFEKHPARALKYGGFLALVFSFFLGLSARRGQLHPPPCRSLPDDPAAGRAVFLPLCRACAE